MIAREFFSFLGAIILLGVVATLVSRNANTSGVLNSFSSFVNTAIGTAQGPVSGYSPGPPIYAQNAFGGGSATLGASFGVGMG